jgi:hypothetical protein
VLICKLTFEPAAASGGAGGAVSITAYARRRFFDFGVTFDSVELSCIYLESIYR